MKKILMLIFCTVILSSGALAIDEQVKIIGNFEQPSIIIEVPNEISFPVVTNGYSVDSQIAILNSGTVDVSISFGLEGVNSTTYNEVFDLIKINMDGTSTYEDIHRAEYQIRKPVEMGGSRIENFDFELDLINYNSTNYSNIEEVYMIITAMPY